MKFHPGDTHSSSWNLSCHVALIPSWLHEMSVFCWVLTHTGRAAAGPAALQSEQQGAADPHKHSETFSKLWITADDAFKRATEASSRQNIDFKIHVRILKKDHLFYKSYFYITAYKHVDWAETNIIWSVCFNLMFLCFLTLLWRKPLTLPVIFCLNGTDVIRSVTAQLVHQTHVTSLRINMNNVVRVKTRTWFWFLFFLTSLSVSGILLSHDASCYLHCPRVKSEKQNQPPGTNELQSVQQEERLEIQFRKRKTDDFSFWKHETVSESRGSVVPTLQPVL